MPHQEKFEDKIRQRIQDAGLEPAGHHWQVIQSKLDAPSKSQRKPALLLAVSLIVMSSIGYILFPADSVSTKVTDVLDSPMPVEHKNKSVEISNSISSHTPSKISADDLGAKATIAYLPVTQPERNAYSRQESFTPPLVPTRLDTLQNESFNENKMEGAEVFPVQRRNAPERSFHIFELFSSMEFQGKKPLPVKGKKLEYKWMLMAGGTILRSFRQIKTLPASTPQFNRAVDLRNAIELPGLGFSGGIELARYISPQWQVSSGLLITHYSEYLAYKRDGGFRVMKYSPLVTMDDEFRQQNQGNEKVFRYATDSIYAPSQLNKSDTSIYGAVNTYYFREVPLQATWVKAKRHWEFFASFGISYQRLNVIDVQMVEEDLVGFTGIVNQKNYEGIQHVWNGMMGGGLGYRINHTTSIQARFQIRQALNPIVKNEFFQQFPYSWGGGLLLAKRF